MPQLATHQLRVGGIIKLITDDHDSIISGLVHDMGNLAKFELSDPIWIAKQKEFRAKYGRDAHVATSKILEESKLFKILEYIEEEGRLYNNAIKVQDFSKVSRPAVLTLYADSRVAINGVTTIMGRIEDLEKRYGKPRNDREWAPKLENYVQSLSDTDVVSINEEMVEPLFSELLDIQI